MKIVQANGKTKIKLTFAEWAQIGVMAGFMKESASPMARFQDRNDSSDNVIHMTPKDWDQMDDEHKQEYISLHVGKGKLRFPREVEAWLAQDFEKYPYKYFMGLVQGLNLTGKLPNFAKSWVIREWRNQSLPPDLKKIIDSAMSGFPPNRKDPSLLFNDDQAMYAPDAKPVATPSIKEPSQPRPKTQTQREVKAPGPEKVYDPKSGRQVEVPMSADWKKYVLREQEEVYDPQTNSFKKKQ